MFEQRNYIIPGDDKPKDKDIIEPMYNTKAYPSDLAFFATIAAILFFCIGGIYLAREANNIIALNNTPTVDAPISTDESITIVDGAANSQCMVLVVKGQDEPDYVIGDC